MDGQQNPTQGQTVTQPAADFTRPPVGAPGGPPIPPTVPLTVEEYQRLRGVERQLSEFQAAQAKALEEKEQARLQVMAEKGKVQEAFEESRKSWEAKLAEQSAKHAALEELIGNERKAATIAEAFHGREFLGETPEQRASTAAMVRRLLQDEFEVGRDASGVFVVRDKASGRPAAEVIRERLDSPQFALFFRPSTSGGSGTDGTRPPASNGNQAQDPKAKVLADWGIVPRSSNTGLSLKQ